MDPLYGLILRTVNYIKFKFKILCKNLHRASSRTSTSLHVLSLTIKGKIYQIGSLSFSTRRLNTLQRVSVFTLLSHCLVRSLSCYHEGCRCLAKNKSSTSPSGKKNKNAAHHLTTSRSGMQRHPAPAYSASIQPPTTRQMSGCVVLHGTKTTWARHTTGDPAYLMGQRPSMRRFLCPRNTPLMAKMHSSPRHHT